MSRPACKVNRKEGERERKCAGRKVDRQGDERAGR